jgi:hypothetical protein
MKSSAKDAPGRPVLPGLARRLAAAGAAGDWLYAPLVALRVSLHGPASLRVFTQRNM